MLNLQHIDVQMPVWKEVGQFEALEDDVLLRITVKEQVLATFFTININEAMLGVVTPLKSGMPFHSRRSNASLPNASTFRSDLCSSSDARFPCRPQEVDPAFSKQFELLRVGPTMVNFIPPTLKDFWSFLYISSFGCSMSLAAC